MNLQEANRLRREFGDFTRIGESGKEAAIRLAKRVLELEAVMNYKQEALKPELTTLRVACLVLGVSLITVVSLGIYHLLRGGI